MLVAAVKTAKCHPLYREHRSNLSSIAPEDVWQDPESQTRFVSFRAGWRGRKEVLLAFEIQDKGAHASLVSLSVNDSGYVATNLEDNEQANETQSTAQVPITSHSSVH